MYTNPVEANICPLSGDIGGYTVGYQLFSITSDFSGRRKRRWRTRNMHKIKKPSLRKGPKFCQEANFKRQHVYVLEHMEIIQFMTGQSVI